MAALGLAGPLPTAPAAITSTGNVEPANPATWTNSTSGYVGKTADGSLAVDSGSDLKSKSANIGYNSGVEGLVTIDGNGSTWTNSYDLNLGNSGTGTLNITGGAAVDSSRGLIGSGAGPTSTVMVDGTGSMWTNYWDLYVGNSGSGALNITGGAAVSNLSGYIGDSSGSTGVATVGGAGSSWTNNSSLYVGNNGRGTLNISGGGAVTVAATTYVAFLHSTTGTIDFGGGGGTLTTGALAASPTQLTGTGTVNARGLVSDIDLLFDTAHGLTRTFAFDAQPGQDVTLNLDLASAPSSNGALGAGWKNTGSLTIRDGIAVYSETGYIGYRRGSTGVATVDGTGSQWTNRSGLYVGGKGSGTLTITRGAVVRNTWGYIGLSNDSIGAVTVDGIDSTWTNSSDLRVGFQGSGKLTITGGGAVTAANVSIDNDQSLLAIDVGNGSRLTIGGGNGTITNYGKIRISAGPGPPALVSYTPIFAGTWRGTGDYQPLGGWWGSFMHIFTPSPIEPGTTGAPVTIDLGQKQRVLIADPATGWSVGASFLPATMGPIMLDLTATAIGGDILSALQNLLEPDQSILGGWEFFVSAGYTPGEPAYLSFGIPAGYGRDELQVWHYDGTDWTEYDATDLTSNSGYASFTVTGFSGYAMTTVPEPGALALLVTGLFGALAYAWRKRWGRVGV